MVDRKNTLEDLISFKDKNLIKVVTGIRRCGKSTIFELFQNYLKEQGVEDDQIITINLEDGDYREIRTAEKLYKYVERKLIKEKKNYVFLDEVQQVENFQQSVDWIYAKKNVDLYITGSNAFLLSGELATLLSGRYVEIKMQPLSFREYVSAYPDNTNLSMMYMNYLQNSSFPGTLELTRKKYQIHQCFRVLWNSCLITLETYYQVSQTVMDEQTLKREISSLNVIKDHNPKYLLTMDFVPTTSYNGIKQINVLEWLLKE